MAVACAGCMDQLLPGNAPLPASDGSQEKTVEVVPLRAVEPVPDVVRVKVHNGDIDVIAVSPSAAFTGTYFVEDDIYFFSDVAEAVNFSAPTPMPNIMADASGGTSGPPAMTHVRIPEGAALDLHTPNGNIRVAGRVGSVTAVADNGSIEVRGQTGLLNLTTRGANHDITVDGDSGSLILATENGKIRVTTVRSLVQASTGGGSIFFSGELQAGDNYFTTTADSSITVVLPREATYSVLARTSSNTGITIQYPNIKAAPVTICGTMDPGWPVDAHIDTNGQKARGQITLSPGANPITNTTIFSGVVTPRYMAFHTTVRFVKAMLPDVSDIYVDTLNYYPAISGVRGQAEYTATPVAANTPSAQPTAAAPAVTDPTAASALQSFMNADSNVATAVPLNNVSATAMPTAAPIAASSANINPAVIVTPDMGVITRGQAVPGHGDNCPLPPPLLQSHPVRVYLTSSNGLIRLLQMSPGRP